MPSKGQQTKADIRALLGDHRLPVGVAAKVLRSKEASSRALYALEAVTLAIQDAARNDYLKEDSPLDYHAWLLNWCRNHDIAIEGLYAHTSKHFITAKEFLCMCIELKRWLYTNNSQIEVHISLSLDDNDLEYVSDIEKEIHAGCMRILRGIPHEMLPLILGGQDYDISQALKKELAQVVSYFTAYTPYERAAISLTVTLPKEGVEFPFHFEAPKKG